MTLRPAFRRTAIGLLLLSTGCVSASSGRDSLLSRMSAFRSTEAAAKPPQQEEPESEPGPQPAVTVVPPMAAAVSGVVQPVVPALITVPPVPPVR